MPITFPLLSCFDGWRASRQRPPHNQHHNPASDRLTFVALHLGFRAFAELRVWMETKAPQRLAHEQTAASS